jgi:hypothetical protein
LLVIIYSYALCRKFALNARARGLLILQTNKPSSH